MDMLMTSKRVYISGEAKLFTGYRSAWTSYCYNGGSMDGNTGCVSKLEHIPPTEEELITWIRTGKCKVGPDCQDCWGSDSTVCLNHDLSVEVKNGKELVKASNNNHFAYHTCNRSWRCGALESDIPLVLSWKQARRPIRQKREVNTTEPKGKKRRAITESLNQTRKIGKQGMEKRIHQLEQIVAHQIHNDDIPTLPNIKIPVCNPPESCFIANYPDSDGNLRTLPKSDTLIKETKGEAVYIRHDVRIKSEDMLCNCTIFKNEAKASLICSSSRWGVFEMDDCVHDMCFYNKGIIPDPTHVPANWKPASIDDVATVVKAMNEREVLSHRNLVMAYEEIFQLKTLMKNLINSVSKIDEKLLGNLAGTGFETDYLSEDIFYIKPCVAPVPRESNCVDGKIFKNGRWRTITNPANCISYRSYKNLTLFANFDLWLPQLMNASFHGTANDLPGWKFLVESQDDLASTMEYTKNGGKGTGIEDVAAKPAGYYDNVVHWGIAMPFIIAIVVGLLGCCFWCCNQRRVV